MINGIPTIDPYLFQRQYEAFKNYVEDKDGTPFVSFASSSFMEAEEGYKYVVPNYAHKVLNIKAWTEEMIGSGKIAAAVIEAIENPENNLVQWQSRYGDSKRLHQVLYYSKEDRDVRNSLESCLYDLYHKNNDPENFEELVSNFGKNTLFWPICSF